MSDSVTASDKPPASLGMAVIFACVALGFCLSGCVNREPFPQGMSMETWLTINHITFKATYP